MSLADRTTCYPDRPTWLAGRRGALGASEVAAIMGASPYAGPWDVWAAHTQGGEVPDDEGAPEERGVSLADPRVRGSVLEPMVLLAHQTVTGLRTRPLGDHLGHPGTLAVTQHPTCAHLRASLDGVVEDGGELGLMEAKTSRYPWQWGPDGAVIEGLPEDPPIPPHILVQVHAQLEVSRLPWADVGVITGGLTYRHYRVMAHPETGCRIVRLVTEWWTRHIIGGQTPDLDDSAACIAAVRARLLASNGTTRPATPDEEEAMRTIAARKQAESAATAARARLLASIGEHRALTLPPSPQGEPRGVRRDSRGALTVYGL